MQPLPQHLPEDRSKLSDISMESQALRWRWMMYLRCRPPGLWQTIPTLLRSQLRVVLQSQAICQKHPWESRRGEVCICAYVCVQAFELCDILQNRAVEPLFADCTRKQSVRCIAAKQGVVRITCVSTRRFVMIVVMLVRHKLQRKQSLKTVPGDQAVSLGLLV